MENYSIKSIRFLCIILIILFIVAQAWQSREREICLATNGIARIAIYMPDQASTQLHFASAELAEYLEKICSASFSIRIGNLNIESPVIRLVLSEGKNQDAC